MDTSPPVIKKAGRRVARGCLCIVGAFVLLGVAGYFHLRAPHFSGSAATSIDITMRSPRSPFAESKILVQASITDGPACASLFALLRSARFRMDHKCAAIGSFTVRYADGRTDTLAVLPGHNPTGYEFRFGGWLYRLPKERLYQVLRDAGVDTTKMPERMPSQESPQLNSSVPDGDLIRAAAKDHTLAPSIRHSAVVFARVLDGVEADSKAFDQAVRELAMTRNERTCQIWISLMHAGEAGLPQVLPPLEEMGRLEQEARKGAVKGIESNPLRFLDVLRCCVTYLTEFDMPAADSEVTGFLNRFELKYGNSDTGKHMLSYYRIEIKNAMGGRETGGALWKRDHQDSRAME